MPPQVQPVETQRIAPHMPTAESQQEATVPGSSPSAAGPEALAQLKASAEGATTPVPQPNLNTEAPLTPPSPAQAPPPGQAPAPKAATGSARARVCS